MHSTGIDKVLVTGGRGFIGQHLMAQLRAQGIAVRSLARTSHRGEDSAVESVTGDLAGAALPAGLAHGCDAVIHLAGYAHATSRVSPGEVDKHRLINLQGTRRILDAALAGGVRRFVYVSSVKAGGEDRHRCLDERHQRRPSEPYGQIKREAEDEVLSRCAQAGVRATVIRPSLVYGPGVKGNLATMIRWIQRGWFPPVPETGNIRSMVDVRDLARALVAAAARDAAAGKVIIVTDGEAYSTRRIYNAIRHALGRRPLIWSVPVPVLRSLGAVGDALERVSRRELPLNRAVVSRLLDSACYRSVLAESALDFRPRYRFESAVKEMVQSLNEG